MNANAGGNVVPNAKPVTRQNFESVNCKLRSLMPSGINIYPIGSAGHKDVSKDLDVLIDAGELIKVFPLADLKASKKALEDHFKQCGLFAARTGVSVHVGIPIDNSGDVAQVDIMAVENAKDVVALHNHDYDSEPELKGGTMHAIWADLANLTTLPNHPSLMMSPYKGLLDRTTRELIASDKDQIAKIIIGPNATVHDMGCITSILKALENNPDKYFPIKNKYNPAVDYSTERMLQLQFLIDHIL